LIPTANTHLKSKDLAMRVKKFEKYIIQSYQLVAAILKNYKKKLELAFPAVA